LKPKYRTFGNQRRYLFEDIITVFSSRLYGKISHKNYDISTLLDKRNKDTTRNISEILENITKKCIEEGFYSISIEKLTFDNNKYKYISKNKNRLLMKFPFEMFASLIKSKTTRKGLKLKDTLFIGLLKYSYRNDITSNHNRKSKDYSAALTIGSRWLGFNEKGRKFLLKSQSNSAVFKKCYCLTKNLSYLLLLLSK